MRERRAICKRRNTCILISHLGPKENKEKKNKANQTLSKKRKKK
jgi:hypothetical protein